MIWDILYAAGSIVFSSLGGGAIILLLSSWLGKVWANRILEKDRKRYEAEIEGVRAQYRREVEEQIQMLIDRLERGQFVHRLQFETEFKIYRELWAKLVVAQNAARALRPDLDFIPNDKTGAQVAQERWTAVSTAYNDFKDCYVRQKPFVSPCVYDAINALGESIKEEALDYKHSTAPGDDYWDAAKRNRAAILDQTTIICEAIRKRIGIIGVLPA